MSGWGAIYNLMTYGMQMHSNALARLQEQVTTGSRLVRPSDDPAATMDLMSVKAQGLSLDTYIKNLDSVSTYMEQSSSVLQQVSDLTTRVQTLLTQAASQTYGQSQRESVAAEIDSILEQAVSLGNSTQMGRYLFGGGDGGVQPFQVERTNGAITAVRYQGSLQSVVAPVGPGVGQAGLSIGDQVFRNDQRGALQFLGGTGASAGTGTSSVRGDTWLQISHVATTYGGSGVAGGASSAGGDTIAGNAHTLIIDADAHTVALDDAASAVAYTGGSTNLKLTNSAGDVVYVDLSGLTVASGTAQVSISASAKLSIDGGATSVNLDPTSANLQVTDSRTGQVLYINGASVQRVGAEPIRATGTYDLFGTLIGVRDALRNAHGLTETQQMATCEGAIDSLAEVTAHLSGVSTSIGARTQALGDLKTTLTTFKDNATARASELQDADITQLASDLAKEQVLYQMTLQSTAKLLNMSLLNYL